MRTEPAAVLTPAGFYPGVIVHTEQGEAIPAIRDSQLFAARWRAETKGWEIEQKLAAVVGGLTRALA